MRTMGSAGVGGTAGLAVMKGACVLQVGQNLKAGAARANPYWDESVPGKNARLAWDLAKKACLLPFCS